MTYPIIKTDNYILITSDEEIKVGDYHVATRIVETNGDKAIAFTDENQLKAISEIGGAKKIVAYLPLNNLPILKGVPLLPPLPDEEDNIKKMSWEAYPSKFESIEIGKSVQDINLKDRISFAKGYKKAKEKYKFTEEDMIKAFEYGKTLKGYDWIGDLIESLSQPKLPVGFKCEMEEIAIGGFIEGVDEAVTVDKKIEPKIINEVMQGEWIFE